MDSSKNKGSLLILLLTLLAGGCFIFLILMRRFQEKLDSETEDNSNPIAPETVPVTSHAVQKFKNKKNWKPVSILTMMLSILIVPYLIYFSIAHNYRDLIFSDIKNVPEMNTALVLGAGIINNERPTKTLLNRLQAAAELYHNGRIEKIILSGDNSAVDYNEPQVMIDTAIEFDIPREALQPDYAGRRTYDSCWRAKEIFSQDKIIVVTQSYHIVRSVYLCNKLGIEAYGYTARTHENDAKLWSYQVIRNNYAIIVSTFDVYIRKPDVIGGNKIPV